MNILNIFLIICLIIIASFFLIIKDDIHNIQHKPHIIYSFNGDVK